MNKLKLVRIIVKDLEEIKTLSEEVAESQDDTSLIIDLALNRARLLCQEIELLRELYGKSDTIQEENEEDLIDEDEDSDVIISDPEFEILNFEEQKFPESEELAQEATIVYDAEEDESEEEDLDENLEKDLKEEDLIQEDFEGNNNDEVTEKDEEKGNNQDENFEDVEESDDDEVEEEDLTVEEDDIEKDETDEEEEDEEPEIEEDSIEEEPQQKTNIQITELKTDPQPGVREIHIDDLDDEEDNPVQFAPLSDSSARPVMHEIPKPENQVQEKLLVGETFQKERSVNDVIGEKKPIESTLTNGPISSLRSAIGLNDRFLFIREIFENNTEKYNTIIEQLDKLETIQQAVEYLKANLSLQKNDTSLKFVELLKRRFSK